MVVRALVHGRHGVILSNTRRATVRGRWDAVLGRLWSELVQGPKMKFEARELLFIFYLGTMVVRALH